MFSRLWDRIKKLRAVIFIYALVIGIFFIGTLFIHVEGCSETHSLYCIYNNDFFIAVLASLLEDIIFFGSIGFVVLLISTRTLSEEDIVTRILALVNNAQVSETAKTYFEIYTKKTLAYNKKTDVVITLKEYRDDLRDKNRNIVKALYLQVSFNNTITNMCKDIDYVLDTKAIVEPGHREEGISPNQVTHFVIEDTKNKSHKAEIISRGKIVPIKDNDTRYYKQVSFNIPKGSSADWQLTYNIWSTIEDSEARINWFYALVVRYTENFNIEIRNELSDHNIKYKFEYPIRKVEKNEETSKTVSSHSSPVMTLYRGQSKTLKSKLQLYPQDRFEIFFHEPFKR